MFSVILYMLRQTVEDRAPLLLFPSFSPLTVTFPKLSVILRPLYVGKRGKTPQWKRCPTPNLRRGGGKTMMFFMLMG
jgi:hypothetical protein